MVWSVTARQWHTYTSARLGQPDLMVKAGRERFRPSRVVASSSVYGAAVVDGAVVVVASDSVTSTLYT
jgi:hypothetical protein